MNETRAPLLAIGAAAVLAAGVAIGYGLWGRTPATGVSADRMEMDAGPTPGAGHQHAPAGNGGESMGESGVAIVLTPEMASRAGIRTVVATGGSAASALRLPGDEPAIVPDP